MKNKSGGKFFFLPNWEKGSGTLLREQIRIIRQKSASNKPHYIPISSTS